MGKALQNVLKNLMTLFFSKQHQGLFFFLIFCSSLSPRGRLGCLLTSYVRSIDVLCLWGRYKGVCLTCIKVIKNKFYQPLYMKLWKKIIIPFFIIRYFSYHILRIYLITTQTLYQYILKETQNSYIFVSTQNQVVHESTLPPYPHPIFLQILSTEKFHWPELTTVVL